MRVESISVVDWHAQSRGSVADETSNPLHYPLRNFSLPHVVQQPCWYNPVKGPCHIERQQRGNAVFFLLSRVDLLNQVVKGSVYGPAGAGPHVLGREKVVLLSQGQILPCYDAFQHLL